MTQDADCQAHPAQTPGGNETGPDGRLLLVIPSVVGYDDGELVVDGDFANNLRAYLRQFSSVSVMSPARAEASTFPSVVRKQEIPGFERLELHILPEAYREDRYLRHRKRMKAWLSEEIAKARYILISPHAAFDWSTLAAELCVAQGRKYNMEADWNLPEVTRYIWSTMPPGLKKVRKYLWQIYHNKKYMSCLRNSQIALVQGEDVYNDYKEIAPRCFSVLNVQITDGDRISEFELQRKIEGIRSDRPLKLYYAGRAMDIKGPFHWIDVVEQLRHTGLSFTAEWAGDGPDLESMRREVEQRGLSDVCNFPGKLGREAVKAAMTEADIFLFCHMTKESPRYLVEALASGTPIVGFGTDYSRSLVRKRGGGAFVERGDVAGLANLVTDYAADRDKLKDLVRGAAASGRMLDRDAAINERIGLMKQYL